MSYAGGAKPARPLLVDRLGRQLLGRHRAVRHLRLLAPVPRAVGHRVQRRRVRLRAITKEHLDSFWLEPRIESGALKKRDTLDELAKAMKFDADQTATFKATIERYNELVAAGEDVDFGKPAYRLSAVDEPPFYAARIAGELLVTIHGVITNADSQPLRKDGSVIEASNVCGTTRAASTRTTIPATSRASTRAAPPPSPASPPSTL